MRTSQKYAVVLAATLTCLGVPTSADLLSGKPITLIVPFVPGGASDLLPRIFAEPLATLLRTSIIVENRPGANGNIAYSLVAKAPKDGHTILAGYSATHTCNPALYSNISWDPIKDFAPIGMLAASTLVIAVHPSVPANNLKEFIAYGQKNPGKIAYGSAGIGSTSHLGTVLFGERTGMEMLHVPYKGTGEVLRDLVSGRLQLGFVTLAPVIVYFSNGQLKPVAVTSLTRHPLLPSVPTADEAGVSGFELEAWWAMYAPSGTPPDVVAELADAVKRAADLPETKRRVTAAGIEVRHMGPNALDRRFRTELDICTGIIKKLGIKLD